MEIQQSVQVVEVMALGMDPPVVLDASKPLREVLRKMSDARAGCAMLTRDGALAGIFTERDAVQRVSVAPSALDQPTSDWMTPDPERVKRTDPIGRALRLMVRRGFRHVPIVDDKGHVVGCVRHKDILGYLAEHFPEQVLNLPPDPDQVVTEIEGG